MSTPDPALLLPISDIAHARDANSKLRVAGHVTAISPSNSSLIVLSDLTASVLCDLTLCTDACWSRDSSAPPELKSKLMLIGHLVRRSTPIDIAFVTQPASKDWKEVQLKDSVAAPVPNRFFVLEAILLKPLTSDFDLSLWNHAARLRSDHQWKMFHQHQADRKGKRKAIVID